MIKVADFGLAETMDSSKEYFRQDQDNAIKLPIKWLAPESIHDKVFSEQSDVVRSSDMYIASLLFL
jgi:serine/threonine protein kinase